MPHLDLEFLAIGFALGFLYLAGMLGFERLRAAVCSWRIRRFLSSPAPDGCSVRARFNDWGGVTWWEVCSDDERDQPWWDDSDEWHERAWQETGQQ